MPRLVEVPHITEQLVAALRSSGGEMLSMPYASFYEIAGRDRLHTTIYDQVTVHALEFHNLIVGFGYHRVIAAWDNKELET